MNKAIPSLVEQNITNAPPQINMSPEPFVSHIMRPHTSLRVHLRVRTLQYYFKLPALPKNYLFFLGKYLEQHIFMVYGNRIVIHLYQNMVPT